MSLEANLQQMDRLFKQSVLGTDSLDLRQVRVLVQAQWFLDYSSFNQRNIVLANCTAITEAEHKSEETVASCRDSACYAGEK